MAAFSLNSLPVPPSKPQKAAESSQVNGGLKPIVVTGNPPTFVSAPGRRIVAGNLTVSFFHSCLFSNLLVISLVYLVKSCYIFSELWCFDPIVE